MSKYSKKKYSNVVVNFRVDSKTLKLFREHCLVFYNAKTLSKCIKIIIREQYRLYVDGGLDVSDFYIQSIGMDCLEEKTSISFDKTDYAMLNELSEECGLEVHDFCRRLMWYSLANILYLPQPSSFDSLTYNGVLGFRFNSPIFANFLEICNSLDGESGSSAVINTAIKRLVNGWDKDDFFTKCDILKLNTKNYVNNGKLNVSISKKRYCKLTAISESVGLEPCELLRKYILYCVLKDNKQKRIDEEMVI